MVENAVVCHRNGCRAGLWFTGDFRQHCFRPDDPVRKPIRIGDTVTIRDLTGSITRINTRATTLTDWGPQKRSSSRNKAFITEQFINWSPQIPSPVSS